MPQGQAAVTWSDKKDVELFLTVLTVQKVTVDYAAVAAAFGMLSSSYPPVSYFAFIFFPFSSFKFPL